MPATINAIHVFTNGSNTSELMLVGNNMIRYKQDGSNSTISLLAGVTGNIRDVYFSDQDHGYVVGDGGIFYKTDDIIYNTSGSAYAAMSWVQVNVNDAYTGALSNINIQAIDFPSLTQGVWGGNYTTDPGSIYAAVRILNMQDQIYSSRFYYDRLGRIVVSQNSRQKGQNKYSYSLYDFLGRVTEAGEKTENTAGGGATFMASIFGTSVGGQYISSVIDDSKLNTWITTQSGTTRKEVTRSFYDKTDTDINGNGLSTFDASFFNNATQRKRIVHVTYEENFDVDGSGNPLDATYDHATHYNYDIHGNVTTMLQDNKVLGALTNLSAQRFKKLSYVFDLISGNVHRVDYQTGKADQWHHYYQYDADNRIMEAYTTKATPFADPQYGMLEVLVEPTLSPYWKREAAYMYYDHGPLARTVLGNEEVQGLDYVYTIQGWIKSVNSNNLDVANDPGKDGNTSSSNHAVARDVMGYSLHYYAGDYTAIGGSNSFVATQTSSDLVSNSSDLYNGNIARMVTTITNPNTGAILPLGNAYRYDQLNRLNKALSFTNLSSNAWGSGGTGIYLNSFTYDANGNIESQLRKNHAGVTVDDLTYHYQKNSEDSTIRNRLYHVNDAQTNNSLFLDDIDDMTTFVGNGTINSANNYSYDAEGRLIKDSQEQIASITWRVDGKVKAINRTTGSSKKNLKFDYDAMGNRIAKHVLTSANVLESSTYYILDAQGNVMSTYEREIIGANIYYSQKERYIYGSTRLGLMSEIIPLYGSQNSTYSQAIWNDTIGRRSYELSNHLGNVLSVISDVVLPVDSNSDNIVDHYLVSIRSATDYSPFGVQLENRNFLKGGLAEDYRMGYQGSEMDNEVKGEGNSYATFFRQLDPRLGRWLSIDPKAGSMPWQSAYCSMDNNPILFNDVLGDSITNLTTTTAARASIKAMMNTKEGLAEISKYAAKDDVLFGHTFASDGEYSKKGVDLILADANNGTGEQASTRYYADSDNGLVVHLNLNSNLSDDVNRGVKELNNSNRLKNYDNNPTEHTKIWNTYIAYKTQTLAHEFLVHAKGDIKMWEDGKTFSEMESNDDHDYMRNAFTRGSVAKIKTTSGFNIVIKKRDSSSTFWESGWSISKQVHKNLNTGCSDNEIFNHLWEGL